MVTPPPSFWTTLAPYITSLVTAILAIAALVFNELSKRRSERENIRLAVSRAKHEQKRQALFKVIPCLRRASRLANGACQVNYDIRDLNKLLDKEEVFGYKSDIPKEELEERIRKLRSRAFELQQKADGEIDLALAAAVEYGEYPPGSNKPEQWLIEYVRAWGYRLRYQDIGTTIDTIVVNSHLTEQFESDLKRLVDHENHVLDALGTRSERAVKNEPIQLQGLDSRTKILANPEATDEAKQEVRHILADAMEQQQERLDDQLDNQETV